MSSRSSLPSEKLVKFDSAVFCKLNTRSGPLGDAKLYNSVLSERLSSSRLRNWPLALKAVSKQP